MMLFQHSRRLATVGYLTAILACVPFGLQAADWPMLGRDGSRNGVSLEAGAPTLWGIEERKDGRMIRAQHGIRWTAALGTQTHSSPVVSAGLIWIGTSGKYPGANGDEHAVLKCFRVADGKQVYEYDSPKLPDRVHDPGWTGLGSSPLIEGDRLWLATNRSEVVCLDIGPLVRGEGSPRELWKLDMMKEFDLFPHVPLMGPPRPCSIGSSWQGRIFVTTNNGVDDNHTNVPKSDAPNLVCLNKETGEVYWKDNSPGANVLKSQFASPTVVEIRGQVQVIVPQSDGWLRSFAPLTGEKLWEFDVNAKATKLVVGGRGTRNFLLGNAVVYEDRVYLASGQDAEHGEGPGRLVCIDPNKRGDVSSELAVDADGKPLPRRREQAVDLKAGEKAIPNPNSALVWEFVSCGKEFTEQMHRTMGSVAIAKGLVIAADSSGLVHCLDAKTGQHNWSHDTFSMIWTSPLIVEDKIFVGDEEGKVSIFGLSPDGESQPLHEIAMDSSIYSTPIFANGVLYLATRSGLFAIPRDNDEPNLAGGYWPQWRGPNRDNISTEKGLLKEWPEAGPPLAWRLQGLGDGISPVSVGGGRVFATSQFEKTEYIRALDEKTGEPLWTAVVGETPLQARFMRWLTQRPPTLDGVRLYAMSVLGELVCLRADNGREIWRKNYSTDFVGQRGNFGYSDCPLVDRDMLICTPGGPEASIVALDKFTGKVRWKCAVPDCGRAAYGNGILAQIAGQRQIVTFLEKTLVGVSLDDGKLLWRHDGAVDMGHHPHTPLVRDNVVVCINGYKAGIKLLEVTRNGGTFTVKELYSIASRDFAQYQDDTLLLDDRLYDSGNGIFSCFDWKKGAVFWKERMGVAAVTYVDGRFYFHLSAGEVSLVEATLTGHLVKGQFALPNYQVGSGTTTPVVAGGHLYVREDDQLFCYDVRGGVVSGGKPKVKPLRLDPPKNTPLNDREAASAGAKTRTLRSVFVPTPQDVVEKMLASAEVKKTDLVYDLGSGDGRIVITAAKKHGCRAIGYELDRELVELSRTKAEAAGVKALVTIELKDLFTADLREANVIAVFLLPQQLEKLLPEFQKLRPGTRIVSHQFEIPGVKPDQVLKVESEADGNSHRVYLWTTPLKLAVDSPDATK